MKRRPGYREQLRRLRRTNDAEFAALADKTWRELRAVIAAVCDQHNLAFLAWFATRLVDRDTSDDTSKFPELLEAVDWYDRLFTLDPCAYEDGKWWPEK